MELKCRSRSFNPAADSMVNQIPSIRCPYCYAEHAFVVPRCTVCLTPLESDLEFTHMGILLASIVIGASAANYLPAELDWVGAIIALTVSILSITRLTRRESMSP